VITEAEMIECLRQEVAEAHQAIDTLAELLRTFYLNVPVTEEQGAQVEDTFNSLNLDL